MESYNKHLKLLQLIDSHNRRSTVSNQIKSSCKPASLCDKRGPIYYLSSNRDNARILLVISWNVMKSWNELYTRDLPLITYAKFSKNLTFLTPRHRHVPVRIRELEMLVSRKILAYVLNGWPPKAHRSGKGKDLE